MQFGEGTGQCTWRKAMRTAGMMIGRKFGAGGLVAAALVITLKPEMAHETWSSRRDPMSPAKQEERDVWLADAKGEDIIEILRCSACSNLLCAIPKPGGGTRTVTPCQVLKERVNLNALSMPLVSDLKFLVKGEEVALQAGPGIGLPPVGSGREEQGLHHLRSAGPMLQVQGAADGTEDLTADVSPLPAGNS